MAEFKLDRFTYSYKGTWSTSTTYKLDDIVVSGGRVYFCIEAHTSDANGFFKDYLYDYTYPEPYTSTDQQTAEFTLATRLPEGVASNNGSDLKFTVTRLADRYTVAITVAGQNYIPKIVYTITGSQLGGVDGVNDARVTIETVDPQGAVLQLSVTGTVAKTKWDLMSEGYRWRGAWRPSTGGTSIAITNIQNLEPPIVTTTAAHNLSSGQTVVISDVNGTTQYNGNTYYISRRSDNEFSLYADADLTTPVDAVNFDPYISGGNATPPYTAQEYILNDLVHRGGVVYRCVQGHTALTDGSFGFERRAAYWTNHVRGSQWRGDWVAENSYIVGDLVRYNGVLYRCRIHHDSDLADLGLEEKGLGYWDVVHKTDWWANAWQTSTHYRENDVVRYGGVTYRCLVSHMSAADEVYVDDQNPGGLENDLVNWEIIIDGIQYRSEWALGVRYYRGDLVTHGQGVYRCSVTHTSEGSFDTNKFDDYIPGIGFDNAWDSGITYQPGDVVVHGGYSYKAIQFSQGVNPSTDETTWEILGKWYNHRGDWNYPIDYKIGDVIRDSGYLYQATRDHQSLVNNGPDASDQSTVYSVGVRNYNGLQKYYIDNARTPNLAFTKGATYTFEQNDISNNDHPLYLSTVANGILATPAGEPYENGIEVIYMLDGRIIPTLAEYNAGFNSAGTRSVTYHIPDDAPGTLYYACYNHANMAETDGLMATVTVTGNTNWKLLSVGQYLKGRWLQENEDSSARVYKLGDIVEWAGTSYQCIKRHAATTINSRPDIDLSKPLNEFWAYFIKGIQTNVLAELGDIKSYSQGTNERITIGDLGTVLKTLPKATDSTETIHPAWALLGSIPKVYYVSPDGIDALDKGASENNPFKTIKYAMDYILADQGARAPATVFVKTGEYKEILPISIPANVALVGDELRSTRIMPASGYETSNMFYVRNGCGIRNVTLQGLTGGLGAVNAFGTRRPTGGAFVSLDPGTGPDDTSVWITSRSTYVQNVTTIGTGCVGCKIDGNLHDGGNKSIVSNDFTQVISDGIGVWCTNLGLTELVSVFTYYCHIGYLSETGGKIRATNGNNSYGDFGSVAEGYDISETPITAVINNRSGEAEVGTVYTDQDNEIVLFGYTHAGEHYTNAAVQSYSGTGSDLVTEYLEFRDGALKEVRIMDPGDSSTAGGADYTVVQGLAQGGTTTSITLSQTDTEEDSTAGYTGKLIRIIAGSGVGQYGIVDTYDPSTKIATVRKISNGQDGWDHLISGTPIVDPILDTAYYQIQPLVEFSKPPYSASTTNMPEPIDWSDVAYGNNKFVAIAQSEFGTTGTSKYAYSSDGVSWSMGTFPTAPPEIQSSELNWQNIIFAGGRFVAVAQEGISATSTDGLSWSMAEFAEDSTTANKRYVAYGDGYYVIMSDNGLSWWQSTDAQTWTAYDTPMVQTGALTVRGLVWGQGHFIALTNDFDSTVNRIYFKTADGTSWGENFVPLDLSACTQLIFGNNRFVAVDETTDKVFYNVRNGKDTWVEVPGALPSAGNYIIGYGQGIFLAFEKNGSNVAWSEDAITWYSETTPQRNYTSINFGNPNNEGKFLVTSSGNPLSGSGSNTLDIIKKGKGAFAFMEVSNGRAGSFTILDPGSGYTSATPTYQLFETKTVTVGRDGADLGNVFYIDSDETPALALQQGITYTFDLNDPTLLDFPQDSTPGPAHPFLISTTQDGTHGGGVPYHKGVRYLLDGASVTYANYIANFETATDRKLEIEVQFDAPANLYFYCYTHSGMGGTGVLNINESQVLRMTITDPKSTQEPKWDLRLGNGVLPQPSFVNRGTRFRSATATITGDGYADQFQLGANIQVQQLSRLPGPGDNLDIAGIDGVTYKVTKTSNVSGSTGNLSGIISISPPIGIAESPAHQTTIEIRQRYSQVRLTFHDFLDIGTGNFSETDYPERYLAGFVEGADNAPKPFNEVAQADGGRVFYASTDQDGNFRVGELFEVEQARGTVTLNADQFDLQGLTELSLGGVVLGGTGAVINEFSIDPTFAANSDKIVPTQKAIGAYVANRITGGGTSINVNGLVAGVIRIEFQTLTMTTLEEDPTRPIRFLKKMNVQGGVGGTAAALAFFAHGTHIALADDFGGTDETGGQTYGHGFGSADGGVG